MFKKFFLNLIFILGLQMLMEHFKKYEKIAEKQKDEIKKEREEQERKRKEKIAKRKAEEQAEMERLKKEEEEPKIKEITDEEAEKIQKELEKVLRIHWYQLAKDIYNNFKRKQNKATLLVCN